jgi:hypothetical protein
MPGKHTSHGNDNCSDKKLNDAIDVSFRVVANTAGPAADLKSIISTSWNTTIQIAMYNTIENHVRSYETPGKAIDISV